MINKEILEIKKRIKKESCGSVRICGCYVAADDDKKEKLTYINDFIGNMPDEEQHKYIEIFRKSLSGSIGKNLFNLEFERTEEDEENGQKSLLALRASELKQAEALDAFYDYVIEKLDFEGNYLILVMYDAYDIPVKTKDNIKLGDSTEVYKFILCCVCPVNLTKAGLGYSTLHNTIELRSGEWAVEPPHLGFLFPAFNDRSTDVNSLLYYVKASKEMYSGFITDGLGCSEAVPSENQKEIFNEIVAETLAEQTDCDAVSVVREINRNIETMIAENNDDEPVVLNKNDIKNVLAQSGVNADDTIERIFSEELDENMEFAADSLRETKKFEVKTNTAVVSVKPEFSDLITIQVVDGTKCLVIPIEGTVEVNGIISAVREKLQTDNTANN